MQFGDISLEFERQALFEPYKRGTATGVRENYEKYERNSGRNSESVLRERTARKNCTKDLRVDNINSTTSFESLGVMSRGGVVEAAREGWLEEG
jgi:hypothetical protein